MTLEHEENTELELGTHPKAAQAERWRKNGLTTPVTLELRDALTLLERGKSVIVRSEHSLEVPHGITEHPLQRGGLPGIFDSVGFSNRIYIDPKQALRDFLEAREAGKYHGFQEFHRVTYFATLLGLNAEKVMEGLSYTLQEQIPGVNHTIVEDKARKGQYYLVTGPRTLEFSWNGTIQRQEGVYGGNPAVPNQDELRRYLHFYEKAKEPFPEWQNFATPIEFQRDTRGQLWPLQIHQGTQRQAPEAHESSSSLLEDTVFINGATPTTGIEGLAFLHGEKPVQMGEERILFRKPNHIYTAAMVRNGTFAVILPTGDNQSLEGHPLTGTLCDPRLSVFYRRGENPITDAVNGIRKDYLAEASAARRKGEVAGVYVPARVFSDGKQVYVELDTQKMEIKSEKGTSLPIREDPGVSEKIHKAEGIIPLANCTW